MGLLDGIGNALRNAAKQVGSTLQRAENAVGATVKQAEKSPVVSEAHYFADQFQTVVRHGIADPLFHPEPPRAEPAVYGDNPSTQYGWANVPLFTAGGPNPSDVDQGGIGDCYLMASLASCAAMRPQSIVNAIHQNENGTYTVTLYEPKGLGFLRRLGWAGLQAEGFAYDNAGGLMSHLPLEPVKITVDGEIPEQNGAPAYAQTPNALWPSILEKAFAKLWGNYSAVGFGGSESSVLMALTGRPTQTVNLGSSANPDQVWSTLQSAMENGEPVAASSTLTGSSQDGVVGVHGYSVVGTYQEADGQRYVTLRNPWGYNPGGPVDGADPSELDLPLGDFLNDYAAMTIAK